MSAFVIKVKTDNAGTSSSDQFTLPGNSSYSYNFDVDWGDGSPVETINTGSSWTHTFTGGAGTYSVSITENVAGGFPTIYFNLTGDRLKLLEIEQWGTNRWDSFELSFASCAVMTITATDHATADTSSVTNFSYGWYGCSSLTTFPVIDTSSATTFIGCWKLCSSLTSFPAIDTSSASVFREAWQFCPSISSFPVIDTSSGTNFFAAWNGCSSLTNFPTLDFSSMSIGTLAFSGVTLDTASYDAILANSFVNNVNNNVAFHGGNSKYAESGKSVRDVLTAAPRSWTITDGGFEPGLLSTGLQGWWCPSLDTAGNGTNTLTDLSGNGNNGTLTNMDAATDWVADTANGGVRALELDGGDDLIVIANNPGAFASGQSFSVAGWIKSTMSGAPNTTSFIGDGYSPTEDVPWWMLYLSGNGTAGLFLRNSSFVSKSALGGTFNDGSWHQITSAYNATAGTIETWIDGVSVATATGVPADSYGTNSQNTIIGDTLGRSLDARIDGIALWAGRVLTLSDAQELYNGGRSFNLLATGTTQSIVPQLLLRRRRMSGGGLVI